MPDPDGPDLGAIEHDVARSKRRSRRTLWLSMLLGVLIVFGFGVDKYRNVWAQRRAVAALRQAGGRVWYDFHRSDSSTNYVDARRPAMLRSIESAFGRRFADWLRSIGAEDLFGEVVEVSVSHKPNLTDEDLRFLKDLPDLKTLFLSGGAVTPSRTPSRPTRRIRISIPSPIMIASSRRRVNTSMIGPHSPSVNGCRRG